MHITEYDHEPVRGLPGPLPDGERILWQGAPDWQVFARSALHARWVVFYFGLLAVFAFISGGIAAAAASLVAMAVIIGLLALFSWGVARTTVYTITNRRIVLRVGVALEKCINLPLKLIASAQLRAHSGAYGDIALALTEHQTLGYLVVWPHVRPFKLARPQPMLRAIPEAANVAAVLADACHQLVPNERAATTGQSDTAQLTQAPA